MDYTHLKKYQGKTLQQSQDEKLQQILTEAVKVSGFPSAMVTLILRRTQHFRAFIGLPEDLAAYGSTDSCLSFCQYVVKSKKPLKIEDTKKEPTLPQQLIDIYGIRSYYGYPVQIDETVVGSLCIVDKKPNSINEQTQTVLQSLAQKASLRLKELAGDEKQDFKKINTNASDDPWKEIIATRQAIDVAMTDLFPVVRAMAKSNFELSDMQVLQARKYLIDAAEAYNDLQECLKKLDISLGRLKQVK